MGKASLQAFVITVGVLVQFSAQSARSEIAERECRQKMYKQLEDFGDPHYSRDQIIQKLMVLRKLNNSVANVIQYSDCGSSNFIELTLNVHDCRLVVNSGDSDGDCPFELDSEIK